MLISSRFAEHGLTGAIFLSAQVVLFLLFGPTESLVESAREFVSRLPAPLLTILTSLTVGLVLAMIFTTGLLLDLASSHFIMWEIAIFKKHLDRNQEWIGAFFDRHKSYGGRDYRTFTDHFIDFLSVRRSLRIMGIFPMWQRAERELFGRELRSALSPGKTILAYNRLWNFLFSYVFMSGGSQTSVLVDQMYLWRTCRGLSTALLFLSFEAFAMYPLLIVIGAWVGELPQPSSLARTAFASGWVFPVVLLTGLAMSGWVTLVGYSRLCSSLFALVYTAHFRSGAQAS